MVCLQVVCRRPLLGVVLLLVVSCFAGAHAAAPSDSPEVRLYALDCGRIDFSDLSSFSDTGEYDGKSGYIVVPCFLIRHPHGTLMWDTGLGDQVPRETNTGANTGVRMSVEQPLGRQLAAIGLEPAKITYLAFSHLHLDHTGNANAFASATWILNRSELAWATTNPAPFAVVPASFSAYRRAKVKMIEGDYDIFGDGTVRILKAPGHTPGHEVLMLRLRRAGVVILAGDLYHMRTDRQFRRVPLFNTSRADTLASYDRIERIVRNTNARLIIQHDPDDFRSLPKFPRYLN
jgi:N-acyl homoserine lactone hydrolase